MTRTRTRRTKTWTRSTPSLVFPAGFLPRELPTGVGVYVRSLGERAAPPGSWSRAVTTFYGPLYLAVTVRCRSCLRCTGLWYFLGDDFWNQLQYSVPVLGSTADTFASVFGTFFVFRAMLGSTVDIFFVSPRVGLVA